MRSSPAFFLFSFHTVRKANAPRATSSVNTSVGTPPGCCPSARTADTKCRAVCSSSASVSANTLLSFLIPHSCQVASHAALYRQNVAGFVCKQAEKPSGAAGGAATRFGKKCWKCGAMIRHNFPTTFQTIPLLERQACTAVETSVNPKERSQV